MNSPSPEIPVRSAARIEDSLAGLVGATPLLRLSRFAAFHRIPVDLVAKPEFLNPTSSIKDRAALGMIEAAERSGQLKPGGIVVEATAGNLALSLAALCAGRGYRLVLAMPATVSLDRRRFLSHFGAEIVLTPGSLGKDGAFERAREIQASVPGAVMLSRSYPAAAAEAHSRTTALEIWEATRGEVAGVLAVSGTGATLSGLARTLKEKNPAVRIVAVRPREDASPGGASRMPWPQGVDEVCSVSLDSALAMAQSVARLEGLAAGISSGGVLAAALDLGRRPDWEGRLLVAVLASGAERYLATPLFDPPRTGEPAADPEPAPPPAAPRFSAGFPTG